MTIKESETMDELQMIIEDAILFFKEIEDCHFTLEQPSLKFSKDVRSLEKFGNFIMSLNFPTLDSIQFEQCSKQDTFDLTREIIHELYGGQFDDYANKLFSIMKVDSTLRQFDSGIAGDYDLNKKTKDYNEGIIYSLKERYSSVLLVHEFTHAFHGCKFHTPGYNYNYNEFFPIFSDFYASKYIKDNLKEDVLEKYAIIRFQSLKESFCEYFGINNCLSELNRKNNLLTPMELAFKYSYYNAYGYIISTIYGFQLFRYYLDSPKEVLKDYRQVVSHEKTIVELLSAYGIQLRNREKMESLQKVLKQISK